MSYYDPDFYCEPSEFEQQVDEFKESLIKSVKSEFTEEMERLRKENTELQATKKNFENIKNQYRAKERELELEKLNLERKVRNQRLSELMKDFQVIMYKAESESVYKAKCDKCDENRQIHFKSPSGKDITEECKCLKYKDKYIPRDYNCTEFKIDRNNKEMLMWYKVNREPDYDYYSYDSSTLIETVYQKGMTYESLDKYNTFFRSKEDCEIYCDWLNKDLSKDYIYHDIHMDRVPKKKG
jgi:hypothetical protein